MKHASRFFIRPDIQEVKDFILRGIIVDFHPEESWYYQSCGNNRCYKDLMKVLVADGDEQAYFTFFEDCALYFLKKLLTRSWKKWKNRPATAMVRLI
ncbi:hypothetical protein OROMI_019191 [Orobanche minor]